MTRLEVATHTGRSSKVIEIYHPTKGFIGVIYPTDEGVRIVSKFLDPHNPAIAVFDARTEGAYALEVHIV